MKKIQYRRAYLSCLFLLIAISAVAEQLTPQQAVSRYRNNGGQHNAAAAASLSLAYTSTIKAEDKEINTYYVYNNGNAGFVILSADDVAPALLARVNEGSFDWNSIPDVVKDWLAYYDAEIQNAIMNGKKAYSSSTSLGDGIAIPPLLTTKWGQGAPYNRKTPLLSNGDHAVTGCVATGLAQILYYYRNPAKPLGTGSWTCGDGIQKAGTYDFSTYMPNYDAIAENYGYIVDDYGNMTFHSYTKAQAEAISELMYAAGSSVAMQYGSSSGAYTPDLQKALVNHWGFDESAKYEDRSNYSDSDWEELLYNELSQNRPVLYGGHGVMGGHLFICDGYDGEGLYHFNWGWDGQCDGYYTIMGYNALNPYSYNGTAGTGFYLYQNIISGVRLNQSNIPHLSLTMIDSTYCFRQEKDTVIQVKTDTEVEFAFGSNGIRNTTGKDISIYRGAKLKGKNGEGTFYVISDVAGMRDDASFGNYSFSTVGVPRGTYKVTPVACWTGVKGARWTEIIMPSGTEIQELTIGAPYRKPDYDLNHDGVFNSVDLSALRDYILMRTNLVPADFDPTQADFNQDEKVDIVDLQQLQDALSDLNKD